jgi:chemotaxis response regulator CheB
VVFGMPQAAQKLGAVESMLPLAAIPAAIVELCSAGLQRQKESV